MSVDPTIIDEMTANGYVRCGGCGGYLPAGAICGYCLQRQQAQAAPKPAPRRSSARAWMAIAACALLLGGVGAAALFVAKGATKLAKSGGITGMSAPQDGSPASMATGASPQLIDALSSGDTQKTLSVLNAQGATSSPTMDESAPAATPTMQAGGSTPAPAMAEASGMPDTVRNWLEHLHKIEQARVALAASQITESVRTLTNLKAGDYDHAGDTDGNDSEQAERAKQTSRAQHVGGDMANLRQSWTTLQSAFDSVPAPAECAAIKANYDQVIGQTGSMILNIVGQLKSAQNDPQAALSALQAMQGTSSSKIDAPARAADAGVASMCKRYDTPKWFDIQSDVGGGSMSQLGF